jgi:hypothetical protein
VATMLISEQELVMGSIYPVFKDPKQQQEQEQEQTQTAVQSLDSNSDNDNSNDNKNSNKNSNKNDLSNEADNKLSNKADNKLNNNVDNSVENKVDNKIETNVETNVSVDVKVDLDLSGKLSAPVFDLSHMEADHSLVMPQQITQTLNGAGLQFNINEVNNLYNDNKLENPEVHYNGSAGVEPGYGYGFSMDAKVSGGDSKIGDAKMGDAAGAGAGIVSHADATLTQSAFNQTITQGANIQFNSNTIQAAGHDVTDNHSTLSDLGHG